MREEMSILRELAKEGKISHQDVGEMVRAMDEAERKSVWEEEGEFDPRRFMAKMYGSYSETMLNDIICVERMRCLRELVNALRTLTGEEREELLEKVEALSLPDPAQFAENPLMVNIDYLRRQKGLDVLQTLAAFTKLGDFSNCYEMREFDLDKSREMLRKSAQQKRAVEELKLSLPMRNGDIVRLHGPNSVEICQAEGQDLEVIVEKICWADTEDEARRNAEAMEIWTFLEGNRVWIRDSRIHEIAGFHQAVNLRLFMPIGTKVAGWISSSAQAKDVEANMALSVSGAFSAENVVGHLTVDAQSGSVNITNLDGKAAIECLTGDISVEKSRADVEIKSVLGDVNCDRLSGSCKAKLIHGSLTMTDTCTSHLDLSTKTGRIDFDGVAMSGMSYRIKSESGDIEMILDERSDCGLMAESEEGSVTCTVFKDKEEERRAIGHLGPNSIYFNVRRGSGGMSILSKSGNIAIKAKS